MTGLRCRTATSYFVSAERNTTSALEGRRDEVREVRILYRSRGLGGLVVLERRQDGSAFCARIYTRSVWCEGLLIKEEIWRKNIDTAMCVDIQSNTSKKSSMEKRSGCAVSAVSSTKKIIMGGTTYRSSASVNQRGGAHKALPIRTMWKKTDVYHYCKYGNTSVCGLTIKEGETLDPIQFMYKLLYHKDEMCPECTNLQNYKKI